MLRRLRIENLVLIEEATLELAPGLNALTGETGAGKTIFAEALGLLLGAKGDAALVGPSGSEAYVEAELELDDELLEGVEPLAALLELRPADEQGLVVARRVFADGRTRAYAWGRSVAREDLAAVMEQLVAMSGQFEQRRLARPSHQLDLLDRHVGKEQLLRREASRRAWQSLTTARRRVIELDRDAGALEDRIGELTALVEDTDGLDPGREDELRSERERLRHVVEIGEALSAAAEAVAPEDGAGAAALATSAQRALESVVGVAPELGEPAVELRELATRLHEVATDLHRSQASLDTDPARLEHVESELDRLAGLRRRYDAATLTDLVESRDAAQAELDELTVDGDPRAAARAALERAEGEWEELAGELTRARRRAAPHFATAVSSELRDVGMGDGELQVALAERDPGPTGRDEVTFSVRVNPGLPLAPVAQTASGGELSRIALAIASVAGGPTMVFDEIDAGIGGTTAHRVADVLGRLSERAQVLTITHLPQIANVAERHFRVEKVPGDPTHTRIEQLDDAQRRDELGRMLGGEEFVAALTAREP